MYKKLRQFCLILCLLLSYRIFADQIPDYQQIYDNSYLQHTHRALDANHKIIASTSTTINGTAIAKLIASLPKVVTCLEKASTEDSCAECFLADELEVGEGLQKFCYRWQVLNLSQDKFLWSYQNLPELTTCISKISRDKNSCLNCFNKDAYSKEKQNVCLSPSETEYDDPSAYAITSSEEFDKTQLLVLNNSKTTDGSTIYSFVSKRPQLEECLKKRPSEHECATCFMDADLEVGDGVKQFCYRWQTMLWTQEFYGYAYNNDTTLMKCISTTARSQSQCLKCFNKPEFSEDNTFMCQKPSNHDYTPPTTTTTLINDEDDATQEPLDNSSSKVDTAIREARYYVDLNIAYSLFNKVRPHQGTKLFHSDNAKKEKSSSDSNGWGTNRGSFTWSSRDNYSKRWQFRGLCRIVSGSHHHDGDQGADCSGFVGHLFNVSYQLEDRKINMTNCENRTCSGFTTYNLYHDHDISGSGFNPISIKNTKKGDVLVRLPISGGKWGHTFLVSKVTDAGFLTYEAAGCEHGVINGKYSFDQVRVQKFVGRTFR